MEQSSGDLDSVRQRLAAFVAERDWDQFHTPKNLAMALVAEAAELVEHFQWLTPEQSANLPADDAGGSGAGDRRRAAVPAAPVRQARDRSAAAADKKLELNAQQIPGRQGARAGHEVRQAVKIGR